MDKVISFLFGVIVLIWILGFIVGKNLFDIISKHGLKNVVTCVWEGEDSCNELDTETITVSEDEPRDSHIK